MQIKTFKSDGGGKFTSNEFKAYLSNHGIAHHISCPYTPQQNEVVERKHKHIIETAIALLSQASLSYSFWTFVVQTAISLINVLPTSVLGWQSPWSTLYSTSHDMSQFKIFGYACYPNLRPYTTHELEPRTKECIFIGYPTHSKGYLCLDPHTKHVYTSRHVMFNESTFPSLPSVQLVSFTSSNFAIPTWLSNQLFLHSTNQPSLLGSCPSPSPNPPFHFVTAPTPTPAPPTPMPSPNSTTLSSQFSVAPSHLPNTPTLKSTSATTLISNPPLPGSLHVPSLNTHPMQTRSKSGISKPNSKLCYKTTINYSYTEPPTYKIASQYPKWCEAMDAEFQALQR